MQAVHPPKGKTQNDSQKQPKSDVQEMLYFAPGGLSRGPYIGIEQGTWHALLPLKRS